MATYPAGFISTFYPPGAVGITIMLLSSCATIWISLLANQVRGAAAAFTCLAINPEDK